ncbi:DUF6916 family protein [Actinotalea fermentans]|uniref:DUF6916 domain-containing protein n=1 Tax=Actinotalea fermentans TaxID=43671 RepID=A0A511YYE1_9CELL|nr:hypothetical protein [Actinotalea fermentans]KGM17867.1 hypothetical protein N867_05620 [Actinotalea fermentans ATCC 43279 = JCM 9966 = DSM 3133]GEN80211.1 hypothetical protein AFE02nite_19450 [Actinotalea fermentans]
MIESPVEAPAGVSRRAVLAAGAGVAGVVAVGVVAGVQLVTRALPLDGLVLAGMVGQTFVDTATGTHLTLESVDGLAGETVAAERFSLLFLAADDLPEAIRTLRHPDGDLLVYLGPVTADPRVLEAVVNRTGGAA